MGYLGGKLREQPPSVRLRPVRGTRVAAWVNEETKALQAAGVGLGDGVRPLLFPQQQNVQDEDRVQEDGVGPPDVILPPQRLENVRRDAGVHDGGEEVGQRRKAAPPGIWFPSTNGAFRRPRPLHRPQIGKKSTFHGRRRLLLLPGIVQIRRDDGLSRRLRPLAPSGISRSRDSNSIGILSCIVDRSDVSIL